VPQAIVDMTKVLEVTTAEDVTSHPNSIAITAPDRVTFVKGTCPEEAKWWLNILAAFPKQKVSDGDETGNHWDSCCEKLPRKIVQHDQLLI
jgi:hypothetical protein